MDKAKKRINALLVFVFSFFSILSYFPEQSFAKTSPKVQSVISGVAYKYSAGDKALMKLTASTTSAVQYRVFVKNSYEKAPVEVTKGYTKLVRGKLPLIISLPTSKEGVNTVTVYVRKAGSKAKYDSYKRTTYYVVKPQATISGIMPKYDLGAKVTVRLAAVNAGASTVQYRFFVKNAYDKAPVEVTKGYTKLVKSNTPYTIALPTSKEGLNTVTVYVRRAGSKASYDNYRRIQYVIVKKAVVVPDNNSVLNNHINLLVSVLNSHTTLNDDIKVNPIASPGNTQNPVINFTVNQQYKDNNFLGMVSMITNKLSTRPDNSDIAVWVTKVLTSGKINVGNESLRAYVAGKIGDIAELQTVKTILGHETITNDDINTLVSLLSNNDSLVKVQQILAAINGDVTITSPVVVDGLTLSSVSIGNTVIYSTTQKTITEANVRAALGMPTTPAGAMTVNNFVNKPVKVTFTDSEGSYSYTFTLAGFNN